MVDSQYCREHRRRQPILGVTAYASVASMFLIAIFGCGRPAARSAARNASQANESARSVLASDPVSTGSNRSNVLLVASMSQQSPGEDGAFEATVVVEIEPGFHLYGKVDPDGPFVPLSISGVVSHPSVEALPAIIPAANEISEGKPVFREAVRASIPLKVVSGVPAAFTMHVEVEYQACNDLVCFPREKLSVDLPIKLKTTDANSKGNSL